MIEVRRVAVVGSGTMGHGIGQVAAAAGFSTVLYDLSDELLEKAVEQIRTNLDGGVDRGKVTPEGRDRTLANLRTSTDLADAVAGADLVIEAVPENLELKRRVFAEVEAAAPEGAVLATNTSSLSVAAIAAALDRPGRLLGMHFFNPVHVMELVEIVVHEDLDEELLEAARRTGEEMGKTTIVVRDVPGFATSRLGVVLGLEAMRMLQEGVASAEDIDKAMTLGYRHPMGPLRLSDLIGLDVRLEIARYLHRELGGDAFEPPEILVEKVERGHLGRKTGRGFYEW